MSDFRTHQHRMSHGHEKALAVVPVRARTHGVTINRFGGHALTLKCASAGCGNGVYVVFLASAVVIGAVL